MQNLTTVFDLPPKAEPGAEHRLLLEIGATHALYTYLHPATAALDGLFYASFAETEAESALRQMLEAVGRTEVRSAVVCSAFPQAVLTPTKFFSEQSDDLALLHPGEAAPLHDRIEEWQMVNAYGFPEGLHRLLRERFPDLQFFHAYTPLLRIYNGFTADHQLVAHFNPRDFRLLVKKDSTVMLAQTYAYQTPLDCVYFLLKAAEAFGMSPDSLHLIVSGLVDRDSALCTELRQYFTHLHFAHPPQTGITGSDHPPHFFTSLYNLAACAS